MRRMLGRLALVAASVFLTLLGTEGLLRVTTAPTWLQEGNPITEWLVTDPLLGWTNRPGFADENVSINSLGFRGTELAPARKQGVRRLVCLGDSGTFGLWVEERDAEGVVHYDGYVDQLRRLVDSESHGRIEIINAGVNGYTSSHVLRLLETRIVDLDPDIIVVRVGLNDHKRATAHLTVTDPSNTFLRWALRRFANWRLTRASFHAARLARPRRAGKHTGPWVSLERFRLDLKRIAELSKSHGFSLLFVDYPLRSPTLPSHPHHTKILGLAGHSKREDFDRLHDQYQAVLGEVAREAGVPLVQTRKRLRQPADFPNADFVHPNTRGARKIAESIWVALLASGDLK